MIKVFYITCIFLFAAGHTFGQASHATISATIVTPVGAEFSGDIDLNKNTGKQADGNIDKAQATSFFKIIGDVFSHSTTVEKQYEILKRKENEALLAEGIPQTIVRITINFD
jgi:hypothetical protein